MKRVEPIRTAKGTLIARYAKTGVGKRVGNFLYFHWLYLDDVRKVLSKAAQEDLREALIVSRQFTTPCRCVRIALDGSEVRFDEAPDFDTAREPHVGRWVRIFRGGRWQVGHSRMIWHHKFCWVKGNDPANGQKGYQGFDVAASERWSAKYAPLLKEPPKGSQRAWLAQLKEVGLI